MSQICLTLVSKGKQLGGKGSWAGAEGLIAVGDKEGGGGGGGKRDPTKASNHGKKR